MSIHGDELSEDNYSRPFSNMSGHPGKDTAIKIVGLREICEVNGRHFWRMRGTQEWNEYQPQPAQVPPAAHSPLYVSLVFQIQGPGEPNHWSIFVHHEARPGWVYQVKGDVECMRYQPSPHPTNITNSASFLNLYHLNTVTEQQATIVQQIAASEHPPRAMNRAAVTENCQGWTLRVISKLVQRGIVPAEKLQMARSMLQPV